MFIGNTIFVFLTVYVLEIGLTFLFLVSISISIEMFFSFLFNHLLSNSFRNNDMHKRNQFVFSCFPKQLVKRLKLKEENAHVTCYLLRATEQTTPIIRSGQVQRIKKSPVIQERKAIVKKKKKFFLKKKKCQINIPINRK